MPSGSGYGILNRLAESRVAGVRLENGETVPADAVILCLGEDGTQAGEGKSRTDLSISPAQQKLSDLVHAENPRTAVLLLTGRPLAVEKLDRQAHAILCLWQPGTEGGNAAARLLFGDTAPCGHLPMTFPRATGQEPISYDEYSTGRPALDRFDPEKNSFRSAWIDAPLAPLYPFGFGLSYTDYELSDEALSSETLTEDGEIEARCTVKNTGNRAGEALVQLYIRDLHASVVRPVRELKGFEKLSLALGEEKIVRFALTEPMLRFMTPDRGFASEKGRFEVYLHWKFSPLPSLNSIVNLDSVVRDTPVVSYAVHNWSYS